MKKYLLIFSVGIFLLGSCQKDDLDTKVEDKLIEEDSLKEPSDEPIVEPSGQQNENEPEYPEENRAEYFRWKIDSTVYETTIGRHIRGTKYPSRNTGVINFDFKGEIINKGKDVDFYQAFNFKVCFYDGVGTYYTGTRQTVSWALYWHDNQLWENHYEYGNEPGVVEVTAATEEYVEGTFELEAYNTYLENMIYVEGEFSLNLETKEDYNDM